MGDSGSHGSPKRGAPINHTRLYDIGSYDAILCCFKLDYAEGLVKRRASSNPMREGVGLAADAVSTSGPNTGPTLGPQKTAETQGKYKP